MSINSHMLCCIVPAIFLLLAPANAMSESKGNAAPRSVPHALVTEIQNSYPGTKLLERTELDEKSCGRLKDDPGFLSVDFDGDGHKDYAVVLHTEKHKKEEIWKGDVLKLHDFTIVVFLGKSGGGFRPITLVQRETFIPAGFIIQKQAPATVREAQTGKDIVLSRTGVLLISCEQFSVVYYWDRGQFVSVTTGT